MVDLKCKLKLLHDSELRVSQPEFWWWPTIFWSLA